MEYIQFIIDFIMHIDVHLAELVSVYGVWIYAILFLIIFCETGLVVTPFLPGDSLCAGGFAGQSDECAFDRAEPDYCRYHRGCFQLSDREVLRREAVQ